MEQIIQKVISKINPFSHGAVVQSVEHPSKGPGLVQLYWIDVGLNPGNAA